MHFEPDAQRGRGGMAVVAFLEVGGASRTRRRLGGLAGDGRPWLRQDAEAERFSVTLMADTGQAQTTVLSEPQVIYTASARTADRANGAQRLEVAICQIGNFGMSRPATLTFPLI